MPEKKEKKPQEEPLEPEDASEEDELEAEQTPPSSGKRGSGALAAIVVIFVVIVLAALAWWHREQTRQKAEEERNRRLQVVGTQLGSVQDTLSQAQKKIEADPPDIAGAVQALNDASGKLGELAKGQLGQDTELANSLTDLQGKIRAARDAINGYDATYQETVTNLQKKLQSDSLGEVRPIAEHLNLLVSKTIGDVDTPLLTPGSSSRGSGQEGTEEPQAQPAEGKTESSGAGADNTGTVTP